MAAEIKTKEGLSQWVSTYGSITAERILGRYRIDLKQDELMAVLKNPACIYYRFLSVPLKNVMNGIVLQQATDYQIYAQKLFVDYLLSSESAKDPSTQGASTRASMEDERQRLVLLGDEFQKGKKDHDQLIANSQKDLINTAKNWNSALDSAAVAIQHAVNGHTIERVKKAINHAMIHCDLNGLSTGPTVVDKINEVLKLSLTEAQEILINDKLSELTEISNQFDSIIDPYITQSEEICMQANAFRTQFYDTILVVMNLIYLLPDYRLDEVQDKINREPLYFDNNIGKL